MVEYPKTMDNRRQDYRLSLLPDLRLTAELRPRSRPDPIAGVVVNVSLGGLAVQFDPVGPGLQRADRCEVRLKLPHQQTEMNVPMTVVHGGTGDLPVYGLRFLPMELPAEDENREKMLWRFLLDEQRRLRRRSLDAAKQAG
jgi:c-di-GMP-binding flagellar brake protein YcgR